MNITIGCDPELFIFDNYKQRIVPAIGKIGGSKVKPLSLNSGGMVQLDGTVLEFGTAPALSSGDFIRHLQSSVSEIRSKLYNRFHGRYELRCGALAGYDAEDLEEGSAALDVGCSPQYRFIDSTILERVGGVSQLDRNAIPVGGHIHVGFGCNLPVTDERLIVSAARFTELFHNHMPQFDTERCQERERILGIGEEAVVRIKPYGVEYRNLPSYWLADRELPKMFSMQTTTARDYLVLQRSEALSQLRDIQNIIYRKVERIESAAAALPDKYQGTLPLDF